MLHANKPYVHVECKSNQTSDRQFLRAEALIEARKNTARFSFPSRRIRRSVEFDAAKNHFTAVREAQAARKELLAKREQEFLEKQAGQPLAAEGLTQAAVAEWLDNILPSD